MSYHSLWRLSDGSLGLIIHEKEAYNIAGPAIRLRFMEEYNDTAVIGAAANNNLFVAPVSRQLLTRCDPQMVEDLANLEEIPAAVMRELRRIYILHLDNELFYAYLARERKISSTDLTEWLGKSQVERWQIPKKNRSRAPAVF